MDPCGPPGHPGNLLERQRSDHGPEVKVPLLTHLLGGLLFHYYVCKCTGVLNSCNFYFLRIKNDPAPHMFPAFILSSLVSQCLILMCNLNFSTFPMGLNPLLPSPVLPALVTSQFWPCSGE